MLYKIRVPRIWINPMNSSFSFCRNLPWNFIQIQVVCQWCSTMYDNQFYPMRCLCFSMLNSWIAICLTERILTACPRIPYVDVSLCYVHEPRNKGLYWKKSLCFNTVHYWYDHGIIGSNAATFIENAAPMGIGIQNWINCSGPAWPMLDPFTNMD